MEDSRIRLLIVEDQELTRLGFKTMIERNEDMVVVAEAGDGRTAIEFSARFNPDVIVMDISLPLVNGIEAGKEILSRQPEAKLLMLTSHREEKHVFAALSSGAKGYCLKDVSIDRLAISIRAVANGDTWLDPEIASVVFSTLKHSQQGSIKVGDKSVSGDSISPLVDSLSSREMQVLELLIQGYKNQEIAEQLHITVDTVKSHMSSIMNKLSASDRTQAALEAVRRGIVQLH